MLDFPGAKLQKLGPSGEKIVANAVPGLDAFGGEVQVDNSAKHADVVEMV